MITVRTSPGGRTLNSTAGNSGSFHLARSATFAAHQAAAGRAHDLAAADTERLHSLRTQVTPFVAPARRPQW